MFQAVVFDIGRTLVDYRKPMNWSKLHRPAFEQIAEDTSIILRKSTIKMWEMCLQNIIPE